MLRKHFAWAHKLWLSAALSITLTACQNTAPPVAEVTVVVEVTTTSQPTATPAPTDTPIPPTATSSPPPTRTPLPPTPNRTATAALKATSTAEAHVALITDDLETYGVSPKDGQLGWLDSEVRVRTDSYGETAYDTNFPDYSVADFVLQSDVTWNTSSGLAGCGFIFRSGKDFQKGKQYQFGFIRLQGRPLFSLEYHENGQFNFGLSGVKPSFTFKDEQGSTNKVAVVAVGNKLTLYANGNRVSSYTDNRIKEGRVAFMAFQESGETNCYFNNSWLWELKKDAQ